MGVDPKVKGKIVANEYVKFASLLPKSGFEQDDKFKSIERDGQLIFVKSPDYGHIRTIGKWTEAFHVFVSIYCSKNPSEIGQLMTYAHIIQGIARSCGDEAALEYDIRFRQWRQVSPESCPWDQKNTELFQEAIVQGIENKTKVKKQPFRAGQPKQKYCFTYNNKGRCPKGTLCPYQHSCQNCAEKHSRLHCPNKNKPTTDASYPSKPVTGKRTNLDNKP